MAPREHVQRARPVARLVLVESVCLVSIGVSLLLGGEIEIREVKVTLPIILLHFVTGAIGVPIGLEIWRGNYSWRRAGSAWLVAACLSAFLSPFLALAVVIVAANAWAVKELLRSAPASRPASSGAARENETIEEVPVHRALIHWLEAGLISTILLAWVLVGGGGGDAYVERNWMPALSIVSVPYGTALIYLIDRRQSLHAHYLAMGAAAGGVPVLAMGSASQLTLGWGVWLLALLQLPLMWIGIKAVGLLPDAPTAN